jgi:hypothetical protein
MPYVNKPRPYKKEYQQQKTRGEQPTRNARERARYEMDKKGVDRTGKDIDHTIPLSKGGTNSPSNLKLKSPSANRSFSRNSDHTVKVNKAKPKPKAKNGNTK